MAPKETLANDSTIEGDSSGGITTGAAAKRARSLEQTLDLSHHAPVQNPAPGAHRYLGRSIGHYQVTGFVGRGGMGEVYRAHDTRLHREVAIKFLLSELARCDEYRERILREARAIAGCNHPSICTIHEVGEYEGQPFLVLESLQGATLEATLEGRLEAQGLPVDSVLNWGLQIASALAVAHAARLVHRDIKPSNIFICESGLAKLLDFGIVLVAEPRPPRDWDAGSIESRYLAGSAFYLSPEQCAIAPLQASSDVFSFGIVLYEALTGQRPFRGSTLREVQFEIEHADPTPVRAIRPDVPASLEHLVAKALSKRVDQRYRDGGELLHELAGIVAEQRAAPLQTRLSTSRTALRRVWVMAAVALLVVILGFALFLRFGVEQPVTVTQVWGTDVQGENNFPSLSPDGRQVVYASNRNGRPSVYLQNVGAEQAEMLSGEAPGESSEPAFSRDGQRVAFFSRGRGREGIFTVDRRGQHLRQVTSFGHQPSWSPDGKRLAFTTEALVDPGRRVTSRSQLWIVDLTSGAVQAIYRGDAVQARWSPDGRRLAFVAGDGGSRKIATIAAGGGEAVVLDTKSPVSWSPEWSSDGQYLYFCSDRARTMNLWRMRIDPRTGRARDAAEPVVVPADYIGHLSFSADGHLLACMRDVSRTTLYRAQLSETGSLTERPRPLQISSQHELNVGINASPDGRFLAYASDRHNERLFTARADGSGILELTSSLFKDRVPRWSPDGKQIAFQSNRSGKWEIWRVAPDGSGLRQLTNTTGQAVNPVWSPNGSALAFSMVGQGVRILRNFGEAGNSPMQTLPGAKEADQFFLAKSWSSDGRWLAGSLHLRDGGALGIGMQDVRGNATPWLVTHDGGETPVWMQDCAHLLYRRDTSIRLLDMKTGRSSDVLNEPRFRVFDSIGFAAPTRSLYFTDLQRQSDVVVLRLN